MDPWVNSPFNVTGDMTGRLDMWQPAICKTAESPQFQGGKGYQYGCSFMHWFHKVHGSSIRLMAVC